MKKCELCKGPARIFCESDQANLCWDCDVKVHSANFLVARHARTLLCRTCRTPTPWKASGYAFTAAASFCHRCSAPEASEPDNDDDSDTDDDEDSDDLAGDEDVNNQVVPWSPSTPPPPPSSSSGSEWSECRNVNASEPERTASTTKRQREEDDDAASDRDHRGSELRRVARFNGGGGV